MGIPVSFKNIIIKHKTLTMGGIFSSQPPAKSTTSGNRGTDFTGPDSDFFGTGAYWSDGTPVEDDPYRNGGAVGGSHTAYNNDEDP